MASASCAQALRENGAEGSIALLTRELEPPYHRPPCTKELLRGESAREDAYVHGEAWYADNQIDLRTRTSVRGIDTDARTVKLQGGDELSYGSALLATGSLVNRLRVDGSDLDGLHYVRALGNAESIRDDAEHAERVVVVGGSYIGCEVAASLTELGKKVTVLMLEDEPMEAGFGPAVGRWIRGLLEGKGIELRGGQKLERFEGDGRVQLVVSAAGDELDADMVVLGTGVIPDVMLAKAAGLELGESGGVKCDARLQTSAPTSTPPATSASTTASCTAAACASSTRPWPRPRARTWRRPCWAHRTSTPRCPTSGPTCPTGARWSTWARRPSGTRRSFAARWTTGSSACST